MYQRNKYINEIMSTVGEAAAAAGISYNEAINAICSLADIYTQLKGNCQLDDYQTVLTKERFEAAIQPVPVEETENPN